MSNDVQHHYSEQQGSNIDFCFFFFFCDTVQKCNFDHFSLEVCKGISKTYRFVYEWERYAEYEFKHRKPLKKTQRPNQNAIEIKCCVEPDSDMRTKDQSLWGYVPNAEYVCKWCGIELPNTYVECVGCRDLGVACAAIHCYKCFRTHGARPYEVHKDEDAKDPNNYATTKLHLPRGGWTNKGTKTKHEDCQGPTGCTSLCPLCKKCVYCFDGCNCHCRYMMRRRKFTFDDLTSMMEALEGVSSGTSLVSAHSPIG